VSLVEIFRHARANDIRIRFERIGEALALFAIYADSTQALGSSKDNAKSSLLNRISANDTERPHRNSLQDACL
jgi:hypothetical protein